MKKLRFYNDDVPGEGTEETTLIITEDDLTD